MINVKNSTHPKTIFFGSASLSELTVRFGSETDPNRNFREVHTLTSDRITEITKLTTLFEFRIFILSSIFVILGGSTLPDIIIAASYLIAARQLPAENQQTIHGHSGSHLIMF